MHPPIDLRLFPLGTVMQMHNGWRYLLTSQTHHGHPEEVLLRKIEATIKERRKAKGAPLLRRTFLGLPPEGASGWDDPRFVTSINTATIKPGWDKLDEVDLTILPLGSTLQDGVGVWWTLVETDKAAAFPVKFQCGPKERWYSPRGFHTRLGGKVRGKEDLRWESAQLPDLGRAIGDYLRESRNLQALNLRASSALRKAADPKPESTDDTPTDWFGW